VLTYCVIPDLRLRRPGNGCLRRRSHARYFSSPHPAASRTLAPAQPQPDNQCDPGFSRALRRYSRDFTRVLSCRYKRLTSYHPCFDNVTNAWGVWRRREYVRTLRTGIALALAISVCCPVSSTHPNQLHPALVLIRSCQSPAYQSAQAGIPVLLTARSWPAILGYISLSWRRKTLGSEQVFETIRFGLISQRFDLSTTSATNLATTGNGGE
jgi:hypothetical protein